jgi:excisionase family DNA binding protein
VRSTASHLTLPSAANVGTVPPEALEAVVRMLMTVMAPRPAPTAAQLADPSPMLTVTQTAALMGVSRMTVIRRADAGELPCVVVSRGTRQKMRRFPRAPIEELAARAGTDGQTDLKEYTSQWLATVAARAGRTDT